MVAVVVPFHKMERVRVIAFFLLFPIFFSSFSSLAALPVETEAPAVYIVYVDRPAGVHPQAFHLKTLASVLGSEEAAKEKLVYSYDRVINGFAARLTPQQVSDLSKQPGVLRIMPSSPYRLHSRADKLH